MAENLIGNRIRTSRRQMDMTQRQFAEKCGVALITVSAWERGRLLPRQSMMAKISDVLGVSVDYLMGKEDSPIAHTDGELSAQFSNTVLVPVLSREWTACCGGGVPTTEITSESTEFISWPRGDFHEVDDMRPPYAIVAEGDCLESVNIRDGDKVIINPAEVPAQGTVALVRLHGMLSLKYFYRLRNDDVILQSDTAQVRLTPEQQEASDFAVLGAVVGSYHRRPPARPLIMPT